jgi:hypothetical protein
MIENKKVTWQDVINDQDFIDAPIAVKQEVASRYYHNVVAQDENFVAADDAVRKEVTNRFNDALQIEFDKENQRFLDWHNNLFSYYKNDNFQNMNTEQQVNAAIENLSSYKSRFLDYLPKEHRAELSSLIREEKDKFLQIKNDYDNETAEIKDILETGDDAKFKNNDKDAAFNSAQQIYQKTNDINLALETYHNQRALTKRLIGEQYQELQNKAEKRGILNPLYTAAGNLAMMGVGLAGFTDSFLNQGKPNSKLKETIKNMNKVQQFSVTTKAHDKDGFKGNILKGRVGAAADFVVRKSVESSPISMIALASGMIGLPEVGLALIGTLSTGGQYAQLTDDTFNGMPEQKKIFNSALNGMSEVITEQFGTMKNVAKWGKLAKRIGRQQAQDQLSKEMKRSFLKSIGERTAEGFKEEFLEEGFNGIAGNAIAYATGETDEFNLTDGVIDDAFIGGFSSLGLTGTAGVAQIALAKAQYKAQLKDIERAAEIEKLIGAEYIKSVIPAVNKFKKKINGRYAPDYYGEENLNTLNKQIENIEASIESGDADGVKLKISVLNHWLQSGQIQPIIFNENNTMGKDAAFGSEEVTEETPAPGQFTPEQEMANTATILTNKADAITELLNSGDLANAGIELDSIAKAIEERPDSFNRLFATEEGKELAILLDELDKQYTEAQENLTTFERRAVDAKKKQVEEAQAEEEQTEEATETEVIEQAEIQAEEPVEQEEITEQAESTPKPTVKSKSRKPKAEAKKQKTYVRTSKGVFEVERETDKSWILTNGTIARKSAKGNSISTEMAYKRSLARRKAPRKRKVTDEVNLRTSNITPERTPFLDHFKSTGMQTSDVDLKNYRIGIKPLFSKDGVELDRVMETLSDDHPLWAMTQGDTEAYKQGLLGEIDKLYNLGDGSWDEADMEQQEALANQRQAEEEAAQLLKKAEKIPAMDLNLNDKVKWVDPETGLVHEGVVVDEMPWSKVIQNNVTMELDDFESLYVLDVQKATPAEVAEKKEEFEESTQPTEEQLEHGVIPELDNQMAQFGRRANEKAEQGELFGETETPEKGKPRQLPKDELKKLEEKKLAAIQTGGKTGDEIKALQAKARDEARRELEEKYYGREIDFGEGVTDTQKITEKPAPGLAPQQPDIEKQAGVNHDNVIVHDIETINEISDRLSVLENIIGRGKSWTELTTQQRKALIKEQKDLEYKLNDMKSPQDKITQVEHGTAYIELDKEIGWAMGDYGKEDKIFVLRFTDKPETDILRKTSVHNIGDVDWNDLPDFIQENYSEEDVINTETGERAIIQKGLNGFPLEAKRLKDAIEEANNVILSTSGGNTLRTYANKKEGKKEYNLMNMKNAYIFEGVNLEFDDVPDGIVFYPHRIAFSSLESPRIKKVSVVTKQIKDEHIDNAHETVDTSTQEPPAPVVFTEGQRKVLKAYGALSAPEAEQLEVLKIDGAIKLLNQRMNQAEENSDIDQMSAIAKQLRAEERKMKRLKKNYGDTNKERYAIDVDELIQEMNEIQDLLIGESDPGKLAELRDRATIVKEMIDEYQGVEKPKVRKQSTPRTKTGGSMLKKIQRDQKGNAIGIRSIVEFVDKNLPVHTYWRKEQTSRKYPAHYNKRGGFIRSRAINSQIVFHEQGHAMYQRIIEHDNGFARKYGKALKDVARMDMSMASANNAHEGFAEWLRRYIVAPETIQGLSITPKIEAYLTERYPQAKKVFDDAGLMMDAHKSRSKAAQFRSASSDLPQQKIFEHIREKAGMLGVTIARGYGVEHFDRKIVNEIIKEARTRAEGIRQARKWRRETLDAVDPKASYQQIVRIPAEVNDVFYGTEHGRNGVKVIGEDGNYRYLYDKSFREIFEMVGNDRWDDFQDYVWAKVSKERWDVKRVRYPGILDGIKPKDLGEIAASYEEDSPDFPVLLNEMNRYFDALLDVAQLSGEFSEDAVQAMKDTYDVYAPMLRETPDGIRTITGSRTTPSSGIKGVRGGSLNPYKNLLESAEKRTRDVLGGYYWNKLIGDLYKVGRETSSDETLPYDVRKMAGEMITELHLDTTVPVHLTEAEQRQIIADYLNEKEAEQVPDGMMTLDKLEADDIDFAPGHMPIFRKKAPNAVYVVAPTIPNKGRVYLQINDPVLFSVFAESKEPAKVFKLMDKLFGPVVAAWKPGITGTIPFALINGLARDIANASFMGTGLKGAIPYYYFLKGAAGRITGKSKDIRKSSELLVKSLESAGSDAQKMRRDKFMEELRKGIVLPEWKRLDFTDKMLSIPGIAMHAALKPLHLFLYGTGQIQLSEFLESLPREGAAMQEKEKGGSDQRVSMAYDTITGNFAEHSGSADVRAIMHTLGFVQAGLNISYRQFLKLTDPLDWKKNLMRLAWSGVGITAITWALKELLSTEQDNERENERPEEDRFAYMDIKGLRIPFDYGMIGGLQTFTWNVLDSTVGGKSLARRKLFAKAIAKRVLDAPGPTALMAPQVKAWIEMKANYSFYFDKEIEPWWMQNLPEEERRYAATPEIYSKVGKLAKMSPLKLKYLVDQGFNRQYSYAFGLAQRAKRGTLDAEYLLREPADIPFIGRLFIREPLGWGSESVKVVSEAANDAAKAEEQMQQELASLVQQYGEGWKDTEAGRAVTLQYITLKKMKEAQQTIDAIYKKIKEEEKKEKPDWGKVYASRQAMTRTAQEALMATKLLEEK